MFMFSVYLIDIYFSHFRFSTVLYIGFELPDVLFENFWELNFSCYDTVNNTNVVTFFKVILFIIFSWHSIEKFDIKDFVWYLFSNSFEDKDIVVFIILVYIAWDILSIFFLYRHKIRNMLVVVFSVEKKLQFCKYFCILKLL